MSIFRWHKTCKNAGNISKDFGKNSYACLRQGCPTYKIPSFEMCPYISNKLKILMGTPIYHYVCFKGLRCGYLVPKGILKILWFDKVIDENITLKMVRKPNCSLWPNITRWTDHFYDLNVVTDVLCHHEMPWNWQIGCVGNEYTNLWWYFSYFTPKLLL